jgi:hypothetical protein
MEIKINVRGIDKVQAYLKELPRGVVKVALAAIAEYILGDGLRGLKKYPPYKHVTRRKAYGRTFKSDKQRRYVMAAIADGRIAPGYPHRTGRTQRGYVANVTNGGYGIRITNSEAGAYYTASDTGQARLNALVGWRKVSEIVQANINGAIRHANAKVREYLKR